MQANVQQNKDSHPTKGTKGPLKEEVAVRAQVHCQGQQDGQDDMGKRCTRCCHLDIKMTAGLLFNIIIVIFKLLATEITFNKGKFKVSCICLKQDIRIKTNINAKIQGQKMKYF